MSEDHIRDMLKEAKLKVTPQRLAILSAVYDLGNHPTADHIIAHIRKENPNIATGTVYNVLDTLVESGLMKRVKTERDSMRYEGITTRHHHLYCAESDRIEDYSDEELDKILKAYFEKKGISGFQIKDITLQIKGNFKDQINN